MDPVPGRPDPLDMDIREERVRRRMLAEGPVGEWRTRPGTDTVLMDDYIRFGADGTGELRQDSVLFGEEVQPFTWSVVGPGLLACVLVGGPSEPDQPEEPDQAEEPEEPEHVGFCFRYLSTDIWDGWALCDPRWEGFWDLVSPVVPLRRPARPGVRGPDGAGPSGC